MRLVTYILLFLLPACVQGEEWNMIVIRDLYYKAAASEEAAEKFKSTLNSIQNPDASIKGYIAVSYMIDAKHVYNPATKLSNFNKGKSQLDATIQNDPNNIELRFLRLCVQTNAPSFLSYNKHIQADKKFIVSMYAVTKDVDLKTRIKEFMLQASICTPEEKKVFNE